MRKKVVLLFGIVSVFGLSTLIAGCSSKPSCKLLYKRLKDCKKMPLTEEAYVSMCDKLKDQTHMKEQIKCSAKSDCDTFKKCIKEGEKKSRAERRKKRWKEAMEKADKGNYSSAMIFCDLWKDELSDDLKAKCGGLPAKAADALMKEIAAKRDAGKVGYKDVKCWDLKRYAKKAGPTVLKKAEVLCEEISLARDVKRVKEAVAKQLKMPTPYLPYYCNERQLAKYRKIGTPYAAKVVGDIINDCYKTLGEYILVKTVPKQSFGCLVSDVYKGIKKHKISSPKIDELMKKAAEKCEKKK
jgi:hypothetical protein